MKLTPCLIVAIASAVSGFGQSLSFEAEMRCDGKAYVVVADRATGEKSPWLPLGREWRGHMLSALNPEGNALTVVREGRPSILPLRANAVVQNAASSSQTPVPVLVVGTTRVANGATIYSEDAKVSFGPYLLWARRGVMTFDGQKLTGDLVVHDGNTTAYADGGIATIKNGNVVVSAKVFKVLPTAGTDAKKSK